MKKTIRHTAVQLRDDNRFRCSIVYGKVARFIPGMMGKIALVDDGCLIGYHIVNGNRERAFLFRTDMSGGIQKISGIYPKVTLLVATRSRFRTTTLLSLLQEFNEERIPLDAFPDHCFHLMNAMLEGRGCTEHTIRKLIQECQD